jgi:hypothetical protein
MEAKAGSARPLPTEATPHALLEEGRRGNGCVRAQTRSGPCGRIPHLEWWNTLGAKFEYAGGNPSVKHVTYQTWTFIQRVLSLRAPPFGRWIGRLPRGVTTHPRA